MSSQATPRRDTEGRDETADDRKPESRKESSEEPREEPREVPGTNAVEHEPDPSAEPIPDGHHKYMPGSPFRTGNY